MENQRQNPGVIDAEIVSPSESGALEKLEKVESADKELEWLSESERYALNYFRSNYQKGGSKTFPLAQTLQDQLFQLYLNGKSLSEIRALNPNLMLGQVVDAAITGGWHKLRAEYLQTIQERARVRLQQIGCEAVDYLADSLAAAHKLRGDALKRYLQTGDPKDLGGVEIGSIKQYKDVAELLCKLTGQDKTSTLNVKGEINHTSTPPTNAPSKGQKPSLAQLAKAKKEREQAD